MTDDTTPVSPSDQVAPVMPAEEKKPEVALPLQTPPVEIQSPPEAIPSSSIGQPPNKWPNTPNLANLSAEASTKVDSSPSNLTNDQPPSQVSPPPVSVEEKPLEIPVVPEPQKEEPQPEVISPEIGQSTSPKETWPNSPILASPPSDSNLTNSPNLPNSSNVSNNTSTIQSQPPPPEEKPSEPLTAETPPPQVSQPEPSEAEKPTVSQVDINVQPTDHQAQQVQSEASNDASNNDTEQSKDQLANFKPEPLESSQMVSNPPVESPSSSQSVSFGDLLSGRSPASNTSQALFRPHVSEPASPLEPTFSTFGDLIKDIEITPPVIPERMHQTVRPEAQRSVDSPQTQQSQAPVPSQTSPTPQPFQSPPKSLNPPESPVVVKEAQTDTVQYPSQPRTVPLSGTGTVVIKEIPVVNQEEVDKQLKDKLKAEQDQRRVLANQARSQRKSDKLNRIMEFMRTKQSVSNEDVQKLLHVSQSTATNYLSQLTSSGMLKREGIRGGTKYSL